MALQDKRVDPIGGRWPTPSGPRARRKPKLFVCGNEAVCRRLLRCRNAKEFVRWRKNEKFAQNREYGIIRLNKHMGGENL